MAKLRPERAYLKAWKAKIWPGNADLGLWCLLEGTEGRTSGNSCVRLLLVIQGGTRYPTCRDKPKSYIGSRVVALKVVSCSVK